MLWAFDDGVRYKSRAGVVRGAGGAAAIAPRAEGGQCGSAHPSRNPRGEARRQAIPAKNLLYGADKLQNAIDKHAAVIVKYP